jgi:hypothetical protein
MSNRTILEVAFRLMGLYFLVQALLLLPGFLFSLYRFNGEPARDLTGMYLLADGIRLGILLLCSLFFLLRSGRLAELGAVEVTDGNQIPDAFRLPAMIFSAVGVLIASLAVSDLFAPLLHIFTVPAEDTRTRFMSAEWSRFAGGVLQVFLGVFLFLSGPRLARSWIGRADP